MHGCRVEVAVVRPGCVASLRCCRAPEARLQPRPVGVAAAQTGRLPRRLPEASPAAGIDGHTPPFCLPSARPLRSRHLGVVGSCPAPRKFHFRPGKTRFRWLCGMVSRQPLRVLCLAGFRQSERGFREKTGALRKALRGRAELVCLSGPHPVPEAAAPEGAGPDSGETSLLRKCPATFRSPQHSGPPGSHPGSSLCFLIFSLSVSSPYRVPTKLALPFLPGPL